MVKLIINKDLSEDEIEKEIKNIIKTDLLSEEANSLLNELLNNNKVYEAQGAVIGFAELAVENMVFSSWENMGRTKTDLRNSIRENKYKEVREFMMVRGIQLLMAGEDITKLINQEIDTDLTAAEFLDQILVELNKNKMDTLRENSDVIKPLSKQEIAIAKEDFIKLDILLQDMLRKQSVNKEATISTLAIRSMMAAA